MTIKNAVDAEPIVFVHHQAVHLRFDRKMKVVVGGDVEPYPIVDHRLARTREDIFLHLRQCTGDK